MVVLVVLPSTKTDYCAVSNLRKFEHAKDTIVLTGQGHAIDTESELADDGNLGILPDGRVVEVHSVRRVSSFSMTLTTPYTFGYSFLPSFTASQKLYDFIKNQHPIIHKVRAQRLADKKSNVKWDKAMLMVGSALLSVPDDYENFSDAASVEEFLYHFKF
jgi:hypothetical protein